MVEIHKLREATGNIFIIGSHPNIVQSMIDFDYYSQYEKTRVVGIISSTTSRKTERYFWGTEEILLPRHSTLDEVPQDILSSVEYLLNVNSGRRAYFSTISAMEKMRNLKVGVIFAENMPERNALELQKHAQNAGVQLIGPASVGVVIPQVLKLGAIGGLTPRQIRSSQLTEKGGVAVCAASGGMVNEIISILAQSGRHLSFAIHVGGDRYPLCTPRGVIEAALNDEETQAIVYYGELGGVDEYEIAELLKQQRLQKPIYAYVAGSISEMFEVPPQFGHAKAMAKKGEETAQAKKQALKDVGAHIADSFDEFVRMIQTMPSGKINTRTDNTELLPVEDYTMDNRSKALFVSTISGDKNGVPTVLHTDLLEVVKSFSYPKLVMSLLLGKEIQSKELEAFVEFVLKLAVDHGPYQSGVVNTMVTARAGKDLVSSLVAGLLTIGPRFGGATNEAAYNWITGVVNGLSAHEFVEQYAKRGDIIQGIGHLKYRADNPDPRVSGLLQFTEGLSEKTYITFAQEVEKVTTSKKGNLILNVDGSIAAVLLDLLKEKEGYSQQELKKLAEIEFFNALFVLSRSVGFVAHYLDQRRIDEGLFRLSEEQVAEA